jgi:hypothetical protein
VARRLPVGIRYAVGLPGADEVPLLSGTPLAETPAAEAALGVDRDGFLVYAERRGDPLPLSARLAWAGVTEALALPAGARLSFRTAGGDAGVDGFALPDGAPVDPTAALALLGEARPAASVLFPDNEPMPYRSWAQLQGARVRYFPERDGPPRFVRPTGL